MSRKRRSTLVPPPPPEEDPTSLGSILTKMGSITEQQLQDALAFKRNSEDTPVTLGQLLVSTNTCSQDDVAIALSIQMGMRSNSAGTKAAAVAELAVRMKKTRRSVNDRIFQAGKMLADKLNALPLLGAELLHLTLKR
jgi:hypothetical protein